MTGTRNDRHKLVIHIMQALGCKANTRGVCHGIAYMGMQAYLAGEEDFKAFNDRVKFMEKISEEALKGRSFTTNEEYIQAYKKYLDDKFDFWRQRAAAVGGFTKLFLELSPNEKREWEQLKEIEIFSQGVELYFNPKTFAKNESHAGLFDTAKTPTNQNANIVMPLLQPTRLDEKGGIDAVNVDGDPCRTCRYFDSAQSISEYLTSIMNHLKESQVKDTVTFTIASGDHTISIGIDPVKNQYMIVDADNLPAKKFLNAAILAQNIAFAFSSSETSYTYPVIVSIDAFSSTKDPSANQIIKQAVDQPIKFPEGFDSKRDPRCRNTWLEMAAQHGHTSIAMQIIESTPQEHREKLINPDNSNIPPLYLAVMEAGSKTPTQAKDIIAILLKAGADINAPGINGHTPLCLAIHEGNIDLVQYLLENGADPRLPSQLSNGKTISPIEFAMQTSPDEATWLKERKVKAIDLLQNYGVKPPLSEDEQNKFKDKFILAKTSVENKKSNGTSLNDAAIFFKILMKIKSDDNPALKQIQQDAEKFLHAHPKFAIDNKICGDTLKKIISDFESMPRDQRQNIAERFNNLLTSNNTSPFDKHIAIAFLREHHVFTRDMKLGEAVKTVEKALNIPPPSHGTRAINRVKAAAVHLKRAIHDDTQVETPRVKSGR